MFLLFDSVTGSKGGSVLFQVFFCFCCFVLLRRFCFCGGIACPPRHAHNTLVYLRFLEETIAIFFQFWFSVPGMLLEGGAGGVDLGRE